MKMNEAVCCHHCFEQLGKRSVHSAKLWLDLCDLNVKNGLFGIKMDDFPELRMLEVLGFITTTEQAEFIMVKVNGEKLDEKGKYFCCGSCSEKH